MHRLAFSYVPATPAFSGYWSVTACWPVNEFAATVVKVERKRRGSRRLLLLSHRPYPRWNHVTPRIVLAQYQAGLAVRREREQRRAAA